MGLWSAFAISRSGMDVEQLRVESASQNIANANVAIAKGKRKLNPLKVISQPANTLFPKIYAQHGGVSAVVTEVNSPLRKVLDPAHPLADKEGFVSYPGINTVEEMATLTSAVRAYEANAVAFNSARMLFLKALDIGGRNG